MADELQTRSQNWSTLFDAICVERGHTDNSGLATIFCNVTGKHGRSNYDTAAKNLSNWRRGLHLPSRKNFHALTKTLDIEQDSELHLEWQQLYQQARHQPFDPAVDHPQEAEAEARPAPVSRALALGGTSWVNVATFIGVAAVLAIFGYLFTSGYAISPAGVTAIDVEYRKSVSLRIGETAVVHGARSACGDQAPVWSAVEKRLPNVTLGDWSDGGEGRRYSRACGGPTPARGVKFTATSSGLEKVTLYGDPITIHVE